MKKPVKRILRLACILLLLLVALVVLAGWFLVDYSLTPSRMSDDEAFARRLEHAPWIASWVDSVRRTGALRDTFIVRDDGVRLHAWWVAAPNATRNVALLVHGYNTQGLDMIHLGYMFHHDLGFNIFMPDLYAHGHSDGDAIGMGWPDRLDLLRWIAVADEKWRGDSTDAWGSVAALHFLTAVKETGVLDPNGLSTGLQWLRRYMAENLPEEKAELNEAMNARAYGCYVLALGGDAPLGWMNWLEERSGDLNGSGRALLAASYALAGEAEKAQALVGAESNAATAALVLPEAGFRMLALDAIEPGGSPARDLAARIAAELGKGGGRRSARDAASMIMALGVFSQHVVPGPVTAKLLGPDGAELASFDGKPVVWKGDRGGKFRISASGAGSLWYSWTASGVPATEPKSYSRGLRVERTVLDAKTKEPVDLNAIAFGQEVQMKVKITGLNRPSDLRVSVLLPAGFEAVSAGEAGENSGFSARSDLRFDRLLLNVSGRGKAFEWTLPCRATYRGTFTLPPVAVEALGNKGIGYLGRSATVTVQ